MTDLVIIADDLTGAGDSATLFAERAATGITLDGAASWPELPVLAVDTDSRYTTPTEAARRVAAAAERARGLGARAYKKIDSLLRGNVAAEVAAAARALGSAERPALAVVAPAFPSTGRTTVEGVVLVHGEPLPAPQHGRVAAVLAEADLTTAGAPLDRQGGPAALAELLASAWGDGVDAVVVDAVADKDLARVVQATAELDFPVLLVGSGGLARPLRTLVPLSQAPSVAAADIQGPVLVVAGSYAEQARAQREELVRAGFGEVFLEPADLPATAAAMREGLGAGDVVLAPDPRLPVRREDAITIASALAQAALAVLDDLGMLVATGGETARSILTAAGVTQLEVLGEAEPGVVQARVPGRDLILLTKAGAFGDPGTLLRCVQALRAASPAPNQEAPMRRPIVAITMGDAAGVGPEIIVKALADPDVYTWARPLVVGDARRLGRALEITGVDLEVRTVAGPREAAFRPGVVDCLDLDCISPDLPFGKLSPEAGEGAYRFVERATQLAVAGEVDAICTAPLNKEALHAAGHKYPGHTELLAELTGTDEVSMMLSAPKLRVPCHHPHRATRHGRADQPWPGRADHPPRPRHPGQGWDPGATHRGLRHQPPCRRARPLRARGRGDQGRPGHRGGPGRRDRRPRPAAGRHRLLPRRPRRLRPGGRHVPRPRTRTGQGDGAGVGGEHHRRPPGHPHQRRPRDRLRHRRHRQGRPSQHAGGPPPSRRPRSRPGREDRRPCLAVVLVRVVDRARASLLGLGCLVLQPHLA
jgi:uncharacterized protein YgbK (DUF1537 family)